MSRRICETRDSLLIYDAMSGSQVSQPRRDPGHPLGWDSTNARPKRSEASLAPSGGGIGIPRCARNDTWRGMNAEVEAMYARLVVSLAAFVLGSVPPFVIGQDIGSPAYRQDLVMQPNGKPSLQITNDSASPIVAFVIVQEPNSSGLEGRQFHDACTNPRSEPQIAPGASVTEPLGYFTGSDVSKVRAEVRAVVLEDGSSAGEPAWINAIYATRIHLYKRLVSVHDLLSQQVGAGLTREAVLDKLRASRAEVDRQMPESLLRPVDDMVFDSAIVTLQAGEGPVDPALKGYLRHLEKRASDLEICPPGLVAIRARLGERADPDQPIMPPLTH